MKHILVSMLLAVVGAVMIGRYYGISAPIYLIIVLLVFGLFLQTVIYILRYDDEDAEATATIKKTEK